MAGLERLINNDGGIPLYSDGHLLIGPAASSAVPGLYTIEPSQPKESIADLDDTELTLFAYMQRQLRTELKTKFDVAVCGLYMEEHPGQRLISYTMPFHVDRLSERFSIEVYQPHIAEYLKSYTDASSSQQVSEFDAGMRNMLSRSETRADIEGILHGTSREITVTAHSEDPLERKPDIDEILEVFDENELPLPLTGKKYYVCIGGDKNFQCFLSDNSMSKGEFIFSHEDDIDDCLKPVYSDDYVVVRQDAKYAIPGFYIVSPKAHYRRIDQTPQDVFERCMFMVRDVRQGLLTLGIKQAHVYHDEKYNSPASVHFWVLPLHSRYIAERGLNPTILSRDIWTYLDTFPRYNVTKPQIIEFNKEMKIYLDAKHQP